ncbi:MAG: DUF3168 domain-containing protein [Rhodobacteraceae bacterium]|nr:DUF3168 domain-containing protein [Paracoccaceae bacterium]
MSVSVAFQTAVFEALTNDGALAKLIGDRVFDNVPQDAEYPYVSFGPTDFFPSDVEGVSGRVEALQIDVWSEDHGRKRECKTICDAVKSALHEVDLELDAGAVDRIQVTGVRVFLDKDNITAHGIISVECEIEEG